MVEGAVTGEARTARQPDPSDRKREDRLGEARKEARAIHSDSLIRRIHTWTGRALFANIQISKLTLLEVKSDFVNMIQRREDRRARSVCPDGDLAERNRVYAPPEVAPSGIGLRRRPSSLPFSGRASAAVCPAMVRQRQSR